jgi:electron transfer flavoprotein alpha/beta subunit
LIGASGAVVTRVLTAAIGRLEPVDLVLTGEIGLTDGAGGLPPRLAAALDWPVLLDVARLNADAVGITALLAGEDGGELAPVATPAVLAIQPGPDRPRYPHPARIAVAWDEGMVDVWTAADLGVTDLAADSEAGALVLGPERTRGQVIGGSVAEAVRTVADVLKAKRLI